MDQANFQPGTRNAIRASLACVQCRSRHLRCDGLKPTCSRCRGDSSICTYMKSRRGGRKRAPGPPSIAGSETAPAQSTETHSQSGLPTPVTRSTIESHSSLTSSQSSSPTPNFEPWEEDGQHISERLVNLYYHFFHISHPLVLPKKFIGVYRGANAPGIDLLIAVMQYIGSLYTQKVPSEPWKEAVEVSMRNLLPHSSLFEIQALLLYAITAQWTNHREDADTLLNLTIDRALALGLHDVTFATRNAAKQSVYAESCRRTWWQLYLAEISMAAVERKSQTRLNVRSIPCSVDLPCSEHDYECGIIPLPRTLNEWDNRELADEPDTGFSSFTYFIGLIRSLDFCLLGRVRDNEETVKRVCTCADAGVVSFRSFCSLTERKLMGEDGKIDHFILRANLIICVFTAEIHRYLSTITYQPIEAVSTCTPPPPPEKLAPAFVQEAPIHTAKILQATEFLVDLLTLPINLLKQSPLSVCQIATPTVALMAACKTVLRGEEIIAARERIRVVMAAVDKFAEVWPRAATTAKELKTIARKIFAAGKSSSSPAYSLSSDAVRQYPPSASAEPYSGYAFLDDLITGTECDFTGMAFDSSATVPSSSDGVAENASLGSVTIAY